MTAEYSLSLQTANWHAAPGPRPYPLLGMMPHVRKGVPDFYLRTALEYGEVAQLGRPDRLLISHPDGIKHVLVDNHHNYIKGKYIEPIRVLVGNGLPVSDGEFWLRQRRLMQPAFHRQCLESMAAAVTSLTTATLDRWQHMAARGQPLDITTEMRYLTQQIIVKIMFGTEIGAAALETVGNAFTTAMDHFNQRMTSRFSPPENWPVPSNRRMWQAQRLIDQFVKQIIEERRRNEVDTNDILSLLLAACDTDTGERMSNQQLYDEMRTIFFGGYDTTSNTLIWFWYVLTQYPDVEQQIYRESFSVLNGRTPTYQDLPNLKYLSMVIEETIRLYPTLWAIPRMVVANDRIGNYDIPAGAKVVISPYVTHRLPTLWEHPDLFDPERFSPERSIERHRYAYIPFSAGSRLCIGRHLAMMQTQLIAAIVAQNYRLCLMPGQSIRMRPVSTLQPNRNIHMIARLRATSTLRRT